MGVETLITSGSVFGEQANAARRLMNLYNHDVWVIGEPAVYFGTTNSDGCQGGGRRYYLMPSEAYDNHLERRLRRAIYAPAHADAMTASAVLAGSGMFTGSE